MILRASSDCQHAVEVDPLVDALPVSCHEPVVDARLHEGLIEHDREARFLLRFALGRLEVGLARLRVALWQAPHGGTGQAGCADQGDATLGVGDHAAYGEVVAHGFVVAE